VHLHSHGIAMKSVLVRSQITKTVFISALGRSDNEDRVAMHSTAVASHDSGACDLDISTKTLVCINMAGEHTSQ